MKRQKRYFKEFLNDGEDDDNNKASQLENDGGDEETQNKTDDAMHIKSKSTKMVNIVERDAVKFMVEQFNAARNEGKAPADLKVVVTLPIIKKNRHNHMQKL